MRGVTRRCAWPPAVRVLFFSSASRGPVVAHHDRMAAAHSGRELRRGGPIVQLTDAVAERKGRPNAPPKPEPHWSAPRTPGRQHLGSAPRKAAAAPRVAPALHKHARTYERLQWSDMGLTEAELQRHLLALTDAQCASVTKCVVLPHVRLLVVAADDLCPSGCSLTATN